jgi:DNA-binding GntR family transcriptional regulator
MVYRKACGEGCQEARYTAYVARDSSKSDQVYTALRDEILNGQLRPGESLSVLGVAERFGASRTPVRDALMRLESDGLVALIDRQGARVSPISIRGVRDLFELRVLLEGAATRQVAEAAAQDDKIRGVFADLVEQFKTVAAEAPSPRRRDRFYELAEAYDQAIIAHTRNHQLARMIADLRPHSARLRMIAHSPPDRLDVSLKEHLAMCAAVVEHDAAAAAAACTEHLANTQKTILDAVMNADHEAGPVNLVTP